MSHSEPVKNEDEKGVFAWVRVPRRVATPEASRQGFTVDFRVSYWLGLHADDVTPARPVGKAMPARPGLVTGAGARPKTTPDDDAIEVARMRKGGTWTLSIVPVEESCNGMPFDVESGPLSLAQGWLDGDAGCQGGSEDAGYGLEWRHHATDLILISLICERACMPPQPIDPSGEAILDAECGVFAWLGWPRDKITIPADADVSTDAVLPLFAADFRAAYTPWHPGKLRGTVCPPDSVEMDIYKPLVRLVSIELAKGRWTLYARGPATVPADLVYQIVSGPRSQARHWLGTAEGKQWRSGVGAIALVTLTSHAVPL